MQGGESGLWNDLSLLSTNSPSVTMFPEEASERWMPQSRKNTEFENVGTEPNLEPLRPLSIASSLVTEADKVEMCVPVKVRACLWRSRDKSLVL